MKFGDRVKVIKTGFYHKARGVAVEMKDPDTPYSKVLVGLNSKAPLQYVWFREKDLKN